MNLLAAVALLEVPLHLALGAFVLRRGARRQLHLVMAVFTAVIAVWLLAFALSVSAPTKSDALFWYRVSSVGWTMGPVLAWHFFGTLTGARAVRPRSWMLLAAYALGMVLLLRSWTGTLFASDLVLTPWGWSELASVTNPWALAVALHDVSFPGVGLLWVWRWGRRADRRRIKLQARAILWTGVPTLALAALFNVVLRFFGVANLPGLAPLLMPIFSAGILAAIARYRLLELSPELAAHRILHTMVDGLVLLSPSDRIVFVNPAAVALLGRPEPDLLGRPVREVLADEPSTKRRTRVASGAAYSHELVHRASGREPIHLRVTAALVFDDTADLMGTALQLRDITTRKQMTRALEEREQHFRALIENASDLIIIVDRQGTCRYVSPSVERIMGHKPDAVVCNSIEDHMHPEDAGRFRKEVLARRLAGSRPQFEVRCRHADGSYRVLEMVATELDHGPTPGVLLNARDVTERLALADQLARANRERLETQLTQANRLGSVGLLAAGVAHEINNPLTYVIGNLEFLLEALRNPPPRGGADALPKALESALRGAWRIERIARDLKSFARGGPEQPTRVGVNKVIESALELATNQIKYRAKVVTELRSVAPVRADAGRLGQVILNLIVNASQAIAEGHPDGNTITVRSREDNGLVVVTVEDTGHGIAADHLPKIFDPFFTTKAATEGSGLGLWVVRNIVESYGGKVEVQSQVGRGSTFELFLPAMADGQARRDSAPPVDGPSEPKARRGRLLAIDDESELLEMVQRRLGNDHDVTVAGSGVEAQRILEHDQSFDLVLCDLMMPELSGQELHVWAHRRWPRLAARFVFMTGGALTRDSGEFVLGAKNPILAKPVDWAKVRQLLTRAIREA